MHRMVFVLPRVQSLHRLLIRLSTLQFQVHIAVLANITCRVRVGESMTDPMRATF